jgi:hypothetical protein
MCGMNRKVANSPQLIIFHYRFREKCSTGHLISLRGDIGWSTRSPDLTTCDYFLLCGYLKANVYTLRPGTIEHLKEAVPQAMPSFGLGSKICVPYHSFAGM